MLNKILKSLITQHKSELSLHNEDVLENSSTYSRWIMPIRYALSHRYLKEKQKAAQYFIDNDIFPVKNSEYLEQLNTQLSPQGSFGRVFSSISSKTSFLFQKILFLPLLLIGLVTASIYYSSLHTEKKLHEALSYHLPYYSDLLHQKLISSNGTTDDEQKARQNEYLASKITEQKTLILDAIPKHSDLRATLEKHLNNLEDYDLSVLEILRGFKEVNTVFDSARLPYYLSPKSYELPCSSLLTGSVEEMVMLKKLEELMSNNNPQMCRTTMMIVYKVEERTQLFNDETELPLFRVRRSDKVPAVDNALGLTYRDNGIGSIILLDRIKRFTNESILPALTFQGRSLVIPIWMKGYYDIEESITKNYKHDIGSIYPSEDDLKNVKEILKVMMKNQNKMKNGQLHSSLERKTASTNDNLFSGGLDAISVWVNKNSPLKENNSKKLQPLTKEQKKHLKRLDNAILPSIEIHEAYHQLTKKDWVTPSWVATTLKGLSASSIDHTLEELGAYLTQLAETQIAQKVWLTKLLTFSLNAMTQGQPEFYASSIIFSTMNQIYLGEEIEVNYNLSIDEKVDIYKKLSNLSPITLNVLATQTYTKLFERDVPTLTPTNRVLDFTKGNKGF